MLTVYYAVEWKARFMTMPIYAVWTLTFLTETVSTYDLFGLHHINGIFQNQFDFSVIFFTFSTAPPLFFHLFHFFSPLPFLQSTLPASPSPCSIFASNFPSSPPLSPSSPAPYLICFSPLYHRGRRSFHPLTSPTQHQEWKFESWRNYTMWKTITLILILHSIKK